MRWIVIIAAALLLAGWAWRSFHAADNPAASADALSVPVSRGDLTLRVAATGRVISNLDIEIKSKASGRVQTLPYNVSDPVKEGDLLVELDPVDEQRELSLRQAEVEAAGARLEQARQNLKIAQTQLETGRKTAQADLMAARQRHEQARVNFIRHEELFHTRVINQQELDGARTEARNAESTLESAQARIEELATLEHTIALRQEDIRLAKAQLDSAETLLDLAQQRLSETRIHAPMDGVVTERKVEIGQIIASGISNVGGGTPLMTIADLSRIFVVASVDESDIGHVRLGQQSLITVDAFPGKRFEGAVERIGAKGVNSNSVVTFEVWIEAQGEGVQTLKPEMTANVEIIAETREQTLLVPATAVQYGAQGYFAEVLGANGAYEQRPITPGISDGVQTEILDGLNENDTVLATGGLRSQWSNVGRAPAGAGAPTSDSSQGARGAAFRFGR